MTWLHGASAAPQSSSHLWRAPVVPGVRSWEPTANCVPTPIRPQACNSHNLAIHKKVHDPRALCHYGIICRRYGMPGMKLCGFLIAGPVIHSHAAWRNPYGDANFLSLDYYVKIAETLERGKFHFVFFADRLAVGDTYGHSLDASIRWGDQDATRLDPVPILGAMAARTSHLGLGATRSTSYDQP